MLAVFFLFRVVSFTDRNFVNGTRSWVPLRVGRSRGSLMAADPRDEVRGPFVHGSRSALQITASPDMVEMCRQATWGTAV